LRAVNATAPILGAVEGSRNAAAWHRARVAKAALATLAAVTFLGGIELVRANVPSRHKRKLQPLAAPKRFTAVVQRDLLSAGIMAPAEAPAGAETAVS
jgi:hypothetical protein